jgi:hypothetical protein
MAVGVATLQAAVAFVFLSAATAKLFYADRFVGTLRLSGFTHGSARALGVAVPIIELSAACAVIGLRGRGLVIAFLAAAALLTSFTLWIGYMLLKDIRVRCGCFSRQSKPIGWNTVLRNVCLILVAAAGASLSALTHESLPAVSKEFLMTATSLAAATALLVGLRETIEFFNLSARPPEPSGLSEGEI